MFVPAYNCARQIARVLEQLEADWLRPLIAKVIVVDNRSTDGTADVALARARQRGDGIVSVLRNDENYGLGGSHKVAFAYAARHGYEWLLVLHGDDQGSIADFREQLTRCSYRDLDALLGSRFMRGAKVTGYSSVRVVGNHVFNAIYSMCLGRRVEDLGAGLNLYRVSSLAQTGYERAPDNLTFNCVLLASQAISGCRIAFAPISWREDDQVSSVKLLRQSWQTLKIALLALVDRRGFVAREHRERVRSAYTWSEIDG